MKAIRSIKSIISLVVLLLGLILIGLDWSKNERLLMGRTLARMEREAQSTGARMAGLTLLLGVDRFMSEARAITNLIGNAVATMVVAKWDGALDIERATAILDGREPPVATPAATPVAMPAAIAAD